MANELKLSVSYNFSDNGATSSLTNSTSYSITGDGAFIGEQQTIPSGTIASLNYGSLSDVRWLVLKNFNSAVGTGYIGTNPVGNPSLSGMGLIGPGESYGPFRPVQSGIFVGASGATLNLGVFAIES
jgi:hypothetical protein